MDNSWAWDDETWAEYFRVMDEQQGRQAATHQAMGSRPSSFAETFRARLAPVGAAAAETYGRFAATPAGGYMLDRLDAFDQRLNYAPGLVGSGLRGDMEAFERIARGTPEVLANIGGGYEPGDITGNQWADMGVTALVDPTTYIPGGAPARASARVGLSSAVRAPGARIAAAMDQAPAPQRLMPVTKKTGKPQPAEIARMQRVESELRPLFDTPQSQQRLQELVDAGMAVDGKHWYNPEEVVSVITRALGDGEEAQEFFNIFALMTAATSPQTNVTQNIDKALTLMQRVYGGQTFDDILADIASNPELRSALTDTGVNYASFPQPTVQKAFERGSIDGQKITTFWANFFDAADSVTIDVHNARQIFYAAGLDWRVPQDRVAIADILSLNTASKNADYWANLTPGKFKNEMYKAISSSPVYSTLENIQQDLAQRFGLTPREFQSVLWVGAADITGVDDITPFAQLFMQRLETHAARLGTEPEEIIRRIHSGDMSIADVLGNDMVQTIGRRISNRIIGVGDDEDDESLLGQDLYGLADFDSASSGDVGLRDAISQATSPDLSAMSDQLMFMTPEDEERSLQEYLMGMHEDTLSGQQTNFFEDIGGAAAEGFSRFAETPGGGYVLDRLDAFDQRINYVPGLVGSGLRGDTETFERILSGTPDVLANVGGAYQPGDITGNQWADIGVSSLVDPTNWIPGAGPAKAAASAAAAKAAAGVAADTLPQIAGIFAGGRTLRDVMGEVGPASIPASARTATNIAEDIVPGAPMHTFRTDADEAAFRAQQAQKPAGNRIFSEPLEEAQTLADTYKRNFQGMGYDVDEFKPGIVTKLDVDHQKLVADAFDSAPHMPFDPEVQTAYRAMASETLDQYKTISDSGIRFEIWDKGGEPYKNSAEMLNDVRQNKRMYILSTENDFGQTAITDAMRAENPLLQYSGYTDVNGKPLLINDVFRGVHDFFGHGVRGNSFGAVGEENAWIEHALMYSPTARRAMTTETRGQNSWVNFGPHMRNADGTIKKPGDAGYTDARNRPFAEQKIMLLPEWASNALLGEALD